MSKQSAEEGVQDRLANTIQDQEPNRRCNSCADDKPGNTHIALAIAQRASVAI